MTTEAELEGAAAVAMDTFAEVLPGQKTFGPIAAQNGRVEVTLTVRASGGAAAPIALMADENEATGSVEETQLLASSVAGAAEVSGDMSGKFVYLRQYDPLRGADYACVALHLEAW